MLRSWLPKIVSLLSCSIGFSFAANAGPISALFKDGIFGTKWGLSESEIAAAFPGGKRISKKRAMTSYRVADPRPVFGFDRKGQDIVYWFGSDGGMCKVDVHLPADPAMWKTITTAMVGSFGEPVTTDEEVVKTNDGYIRLVAMRWTLDEGFDVKAENKRVGLMYIARLSIDYCGPRNKKSKADLGF